ARPLERIHGSSDRAQPGVAGRAAISPGAASPLVVADSRGASVMGAACRAARRRIRLVSGQVTRVARLLPSQAIAWFDRRGDARENVNQAGETPARFAAGLGVRSLLASVLFFDWR